MVIAYLPGALGWVYLFTLDQESTSLSLINNYYIMNFLSISAPLLGYFGVEFLYLRCFYIGNSSGLYVSNKFSYWLTFANGVTY